MATRFRMLIAAVALLGVAASPTPQALEVPGRSNATPWVAAAGELVAVAWGAAAAGGTDVFVSVSRDGGRNFAAPFQVNIIPGEGRLGGEMPPRVVVQPPSGNQRARIAVLWTARGATTAVKMSRSEDEGRSFEAPVTLQGASAAGDRGWPALAIDGHGEVHAIWLDHRGLAAATSTRDTSSHEGVHDGVAMAQRSALFYAGGGTPAERPITTGVCYCCKTALAAGPDGTLFAAWRHVYAGNLRDIAMTASRDGGRTFSAPARVSEDGWSINGCPDDGPALAVDADGIAHLVWPTVIPGAEPQGAIFYASTRDGEHVTPRVRIPTAGGPKPSHPQIAIDADGTIAIAWDEAVAGRRVAYVRTMSPGPAPAFGRLELLGPADGPAIYPVLAGTRRGFIAVWTTGGDSSRVEYRLVGSR